jgi:hypothetical protein
MSEPMEGPSQPPKKPNPTAIIATVLGVLAVICCGGGILVVAVMFPTFNKARANARAAIRRGSCLSNLHQISHAIELYSADNDEFLPRADAWMDLVKRYGLKERNLQCPEVRSVNKKDFGYAFNDVVSRKKAASFGKNIWLVCDSKFLERNAHSSSISIPNPGRHGTRQKLDNVLMLDGTVKTQDPAKLALNP